MARTKKPTGALLDQRYEMVEITQLVPHPDNPNRGASELIADSIQANGFYGAVVAQKSSRRILAGHYRLQELEKSGETHVPVIWLDVDDHKAKRILLADNGTGRAGGYDRDMLLALLKAAAGQASGLHGTGFTAGDLARLSMQMTRAAQGGDRTPSLADRFIVPPFSVLDRRQGYIGWSAEPSGTCLASTAGQGEARTAQKGLTPG